MTRQQALLRIEDIKKQMKGHYKDNYFLYDRGDIPDFRPTMPAKVLDNYLKDNVYREFAILSYILDESKRNVYEREIEYAANWFEHPHPDGRDHRGEADFEAIRLVPLLFECYDALKPDTKQAVDRFFLQRDFSALYESENHALMYKVSRYLAAIFYKGRFFEQFGMSSEQIIKKDEQFLKEFYDFRAKRGWGEFDSIGYAGEIMLITALLHRYTDNPVMKTRAGMAMDIILLDMICDGKDGIYGGAHGRIYPNTALSGEGGMVALYDYYFGSPYADKMPEVSPDFLLCDYVPSEIVYKIECKRTYPYANREQKHLHSLKSWVYEDINYKTLEMLEGRGICKYTYVDEDYVLGAVNHQDAYPSDSPDAGYAHHQQHEWDLTLSGARNHKIFSHHPGDPGYHKIHNRWTGDWQCLCSTHYANHNTVISIYNIVKQKEFPYINACVPFDCFDEAVKEEKYIFLKYANKIYVSLYFDNGYEIGKDEDYGVCEVVSRGRQNCCVLRVAKSAQYPDFAAFIEDIKLKKIVYDRDKQTVEFDGIKVWYHGNSENGRENVYNYGYTYDNPYMKSVWDSGIIECRVGDDCVVYDFNSDSIIQK